MMERAGLHGVDFHIIFRLFSERVPESLVQTEMDGPSREATSPESRVQEGALWNQRETHFSHEISSGT